MAEASHNHNDSEHTADALFQKLVRVHRMRVADAADQIGEAFWADQLLLRFHIQGGAR